MTKNVLKNGNDKEVAFIQAVGYVWGLPATTSVQVVMKSKSGNEIKTEIIWNESASDALNETIEEAGVTINDITKCTVQQIANSLLGPKNETIYTVWE